MNLDSIVAETALAGSVANYRGVPLLLATKIANARVQVSIAEMAGDADGRDARKKRAELALLEVQAAYALLAQNHG